MRLHYSFQDMDNLYLVRPPVFYGASPPLLRSDAQQVLEYMGGGDLLNLSKIPGGLHSFLRCTGPEILSAS